MRRPQHQDHLNAKESGNKRLKRTLAKKIMNY